MAFYLSSDRSPANLYVWTTSGSPPRGASPTPSTRTSILRTSWTRDVVRFKSFDGMAIPNILWKPQQASARPRPPPSSGCTAARAARRRKGYNALIQYLVNHGYAVLGINNRGSSGYGKSFYTADDQKHGSEPLWDCVEAKKYLASQP